MRRVYVLLLILFASLCVKAQISVKEGSFKEVGQFYTMKEDMTDDNYTPYAVIRVKGENMSPDELQKLNFKGDARTFIEVEPQENEVWVYLTYLATYLKITHPDLSSTEFAIPYDLEPLHGYELVVVSGAAATGGGKGTITVITTPAGSSVTINGVKVSDTTPYTNDMMAAGHYEVLVQHKDYQDVTRYVDIADGKEVTVNIDMNLSYVITNIETYPAGATVYIDGVKRGVTPLNINDLQVGKHNLKLVKDEYDVVEDVMILEEGKVFNYRMQLVVTQIIKSFEAKKVPFDMVLVKGGPTGDFYIGKTEVTRRLYMQVMNVKPGYNPDGSCPMERITYDDCIQFIKKLNKLTKANFRLPTRAEWEYAAKGGKWSQGFVYSGSNNLDQVAWYNGNSGSYLMGSRHTKEQQQDYYNMTRNVHHVAEKQANELGLYDMSGNVYEMCTDVDANGYHCAMGGSYSCEADRCKTTSSVYFKPDMKAKDLGLRLILQ